MSYESEINSIIDKIRETFIAILPEEKLKDFVQSALDSFFAKNQSVYGSSGRNSAFNLLCERIFTEVLSPQIKNIALEYLHTNEVKNQIETEIKNNLSSLIGAFEMTVVKMLEGDFYLRGDD